jgi:hypothetical protein
LESAAGVVAASCRGCVAGEGCITVEGCAAGPGFGTFVLMLWLPPGPEVVESESAAEEADCGGT